MIRSVNYLFLATLLLVPASVSAAQINCGEGCGSQGCTSKSCKCRKGKRCNNQCQAGAYCEPCQDRCTFRSRWQDWGTNWTGRCGPIGAPARRGCRLAQTAAWCIDTKGSGDSGWSPPARLPVNRTNTGFNSFLATGGAAGGAAPMVFQPTDTAQLGYSYAHVPTWQRNPAMIPPTPSPSAFHARFCPRDPRSGACIDTGGAGCMIGGGEIIHGEVIGGDYCPSYSHVAPQPSFNVPQQIAVRTPRPRPQPAAVNMAQRHVQFAAGSRATNAQSGRRAVRQTSARRPQQSGGWFGLPSLKDIKF